MSRTSSIVELAPLSGPGIERPPAVHLAGESHSVPTVIPDLADGAESALAGAQVTRARSVVIILSIVMVTGVSSLLNGLTTVVLPTLDKELHLGTQLQVWPISITALTCGCTLLLAGAICDAIGAKIMYLIGTALQTAFVLGTGLSENGFQLVFFRGLTGIAISFCLPSAVSIITTSFSGKQRNMAFACLGAGQPTGFALGLVLGGVLTEFVTWRAGYYIGAGITAVNIALVFWAVPTGTIGALPWAQKRQKIFDEIDWVGAAIASTSLASASYVFATIAGSSRQIRQPSTIALLSLAIALIPAFIFWVGRQEGLGRPAIIPNSLWRNRLFTTICLAVFLTWGSFNSIETILTLYFQDVQLLSPLQTSLRFLPAAASGVAINLVAGALVHRVSANTIVIAGLTATLCSPVIMAVSSPAAPYWSSGFLANVFNPISADCLFTIANLLITSVFPAKTQALAGGVFNTISQIGKSVGVALAAVVAASVTAGSAEAVKTGPEALLEGYRAAFWFCFALGVVTIVLNLWGLRGVGKVGHKRD